MRYNISEIVHSSFEYDDLYHHTDLRRAILSLLNPSLEKIKTTRDLLSKANLPWPVHHHIIIRLELIEEIIPRDGIYHP